MYLQTNRERVRKIGCIHTQVAREKETDGLNRVHLYPKKREMEKDGVLP